MQVNHSSEVAQLMQRIRDEHEAAQRGLNGLADGTVKHKFIEAHMQRVWKLKDELGKQVGEKEALTAMCGIILGE